jgi:hypothetical protein
MYGMSDLFEVFSGYAVQERTVHNHLLTLAGERLYLGKWYVFVEKST